MGVGVCLLSWQEMRDCGMRGKGLKILHLYGDKLWYTTYISAYVRTCSLFNTLKYVLGRPHLTTLPLATYLRMLSEIPENY